MKRLILIATVLTAGTLMVAAQQAQPQPRAFGDKDNDGVCDVTGMPVGHHRAMMHGRGGHDSAGYGHCWRDSQGRRGKGHHGGPVPPAGDGQAPKKEAPAEQSE